MYASTCRSSGSTSAWAAVAGSIPIPVSATSARADTPMRPAAARREVSEGSGLMMSSSSTNCPHPTARCASLSTPQMRGTLRGRVLPLEARGRAGALGLIEHDLADAHDLGRHLDALVFARELEALLERQLTRHVELLEGIGRGGAHVG